MPEYTAATYKPVHGGFPGQIMETETGGGYVVMPVSADTADTADTTDSDGTYKYGEYVDYVSGPIVFRWRNYSENLIALMAEAEPSAIYFLINEEDDLS